MLPATATNSSLVTLTVLTPPAITAQPQPRTVAAGSTVAFAVGATGSAPLSFQWYLNGAKYRGANAFAYVLSNAQSSSNGNYSVVITNVYNSVTSSVAQLTVVPQISLSSSNLVLVRVGDGAQTPTLNGIQYFWINSRPTEITSIQYPFQTAGRPR